LASNNLTENVPDPDCDQYGGDRVIADERLNLIVGLARLIDLPLNRLADVGDGSLWSVTHISTSPTGDPTAAAGSMVLSAAVDPPPLASRDRSPAAPHEIHDQNHQEDDQEDVEQDLRDPRCSSGYATEAEEGRDKGDNQSDERVVKQVACRHEPSLQPIAARGAPEGPSSKRQQRRRHPYGNTLRNGTGLIDHDHVSE
jgi:hypothetical protein